MQTPQEGESKGGRNTVKAGSAVGKWVRILVAPNDEGIKMPKMIKEDEVGGWK